MKYVIFPLLCLLWFSTVDAKDHGPEIPEIDEIINWIPEEVPRTVSFYIDINDDNLVDLIITYSLIEAYACMEGENCVYDIKDNGDHWLLPSDGYVYYVVKRWTFWKYVDEKDWRGEEKSSEFVYKYKKHDDWYNDRFLKLWPDMAP